MKYTCELCRNFCSAHHDLRIDGNAHLIGQVGSCCVDKAAQRAAVLRERHPERRHDTLSIAEFRELTRPLRPHSPNRFGRPRRAP